MKSEYVYFFGTADGDLIKIGFTANDLTKRRGQLERTPWGRRELVLLAAVRGSRTNEAGVLRTFQPLSFEDERETFYAADELTHYVNWLRHQWWTTFDESVPVDEMVTYDRWRPQIDRRIGPPPDTPDTLFNVAHTFSGQLATTPWAWMATPTQQLGEDFYTPVEIVEAARSAMGGIDLDAASHWWANRLHRIPEFFHQNRSAFDHDWFGKVWLNPPYGNNGPWLERIVDQWPHIDQLVMISPAWAFTTKIAKPVMDLASAAVLLSPTPEFWGNPDGRTGTNHPHLVVYLGDHAARFVEAFRPFGIPVELV